MYLTPHRSSAMAMFGFVYLWYFAVVLLVEIWLEYRVEIVQLAQTSSGWKRIVYKLLTLGSHNISPESLRIDDKVGCAVTVIGIPSAFLLHGYVGFIFGSIKANPWWSTPLMPVVFLFSAMVSGIAAVLSIYAASMKLRKVSIDMRCLDTIAKFMTSRNFQTTRLVLGAATALVCSGIAAACLIAVYHRAFGAASQAYCATLRTAVVAGMSLLFAWAAPRWNYPELSRLIYPAMSLAGYRLVTQDMHEQKAALFASLLVVGATLMALPRSRKAAAQKLTSKDRQPVSVLTS